jgi:hypothetical protein
LTPATPSSKRYFLLLVDDLSRYMWLQLLSSKDEAPSQIKKFQAVVEVEIGKKLKVIRTDRGGSSHRLNSASTAPSTTSNGSSPPLIHHNRMGWWRGRTRASLGWRGA